MSSVIRELKRRKVFRVAVVYAATAFVAAFEAYLRGREIFQAAHGPPGGSLAEANAWFERAMRLDPRFCRPAFLHADRYAHRVFGPGNSRSSPCTSMTLAVR